MVKEIDFSNEDEIVALVIYLGSGSHFCVKTTLKFARNAMEEWKKFYVYYGTDPEKRQDMDKPFSIYHFMDGYDHANASLVFAPIQGMQIAPLQQEESWRG